MDALDREFALLAASVERTARVQRDEVHRFVETAPRDRIPQVRGRSEDSDRRLRHGAALARHLSAAYDALLQHVELRRVDYAALPDEVAKRGAVIEMRQLVAGARNLHSSLGWLDAARSPALDLGTRYLVDHVAARLVAAEAEVTVVAGETSYAKVTNPLSPVFTLSDAELPEDDLAIVIFVPRRERRSGLLHPLIVHELAHAANDRHSLVSKVFQAATETKELQALLGEAAGAGSSADGSDEDEAARVQELAITLAAWTEEAVCDAFAVQLLGPTYLYSFMAIVGTSDLDRTGNEHPPTRQRIRLVLAQLDALGWTEQMRSETGEIDGWFRETATAAAKYVDPEEQFCVTALERLAPFVRAVASEHVGASTFDAADFADVWPELEGLLQAGIPPSQTSGLEPIERAAIILGSWLFAVQREGPNLAALAKAADVPELSRLLPKALQDAAIIEAWAS